MDKVRLWPILCVITFLRIHETRTAWLSWNWILINLCRCRLSKRFLFFSSSSRSEQQASQQQFPPSGYLTLVPLSETTRTRQPRSARLTALYMLTFALIIASTVYVMVPRTMSIGQVDVVPDQMLWNTTKAWYQVRLNVTIPVYNPNFLPTNVSGRLQVLFYDALAGSKKIHTTTIARRSLPSMLTLTMDASDVPKDYILSIISQCSTFPHALTFFLQGDVHAKGIWQFFGPTQVADIDTYFMVDCNGWSDPLGWIWATENRRDRKRACFASVHVRKIRGRGQPPFYWFIFVLFNGRK